MSGLASLARVGVTLGKTRALDNVSFDIERGNIIALLGPNGAGKTTLLRVALGLAVVNTGHVLLGGDDPRALHPRARALRAAYLPQRPQALWPVSVESLVALGRFAYGAAPDRLGAADHAAVDAALDACALSHLHARPMNTLSGGERMRAHLARALAQSAPLLVLDEPTAGLDPAQALAVSDIVSRHARAGGAVIFSSHDIAFAARTARRIVLMHEGRVIADGAPEAALTPSGLKQAYGRKGRLERLGDAYAAVFE